MPGYEISLRDNDGREVADGEEGILWVRGDSNAPCYWNRPDKTAETMREGGWIYTGDRFVRDADGFHFFQGRADDLVKISGQWVYPLEVELCLANHPMVRECAVLAMEGADRLTTLKAFVVLADSTAEATKRCRNTSRPNSFPTNTRGRSRSWTSCQDRDRQDRPAGGDADLASRHYKRRDAIQVFQRRWIASPPRSSQ